MTIQLSVTVWTILCFIALMLILHHLLFKPVLRMMDARRERIRKASEKKAAYARMAEEHETMQLEKRAADEAARKKQLKAEIEAIRSEAKNAVEAAQDARLCVVDEYRAKADEDKAAILEVLSAHSAELAASFAKSVVKE